MVLVRGLLRREQDLYTMRIETTSMGNLALNCFTPAGAALLIETMHTIICSTPTDDLDLEQGL